jgi:Flp pilus assembly protein TadG
MLQRTNIVYQGPRVKIADAHPRRHRGAAMVELAVTLSMLTTLIFGMVEFGYAYYVKNMLAGAAREGVRAGIVSGAVEADVTTAISNALKTTNWTTNSYYTVAITNASTGADISNSLGSQAAGTQVQVSVSGTWSNLGKGFSPLKLLGSSKSMVGTCVMRREP